MKQPELICSACLPKPKRFTRVEQCYCNGRGFITKYSEQGSTSAAWNEKCPNCDGSGWIRKETIYLIEG